MSTDHPKDEEEHYYVNDYEVQEDPFVYDNGVLINHFAIKSTKELNLVEADLISNQIIQFKKSPVTGKYDLEHAQKIHQFLFGDVYPWAGQIRTVDIAKGATYFCRNQYIQSSFEELHHTLVKNDYLKSLEKDRVGLCHELAKYFNAVNMIHPFREGNGRTQRALIGLLAEERGHRINWGGISPEYMKIANADKLAKQLLINTDKIPSHESKQ